MFRTILKKHSEEIFSNSMKGYARCAYCGKTILQSDKYCQYCRRARKKVPAQREVIRLDPREVNEIKFNEDEWKHAEEMMRYSIAKNPNTGNIEIRPMNGKEFIEIFGPTDMKFFIECLEEYLKASDRTVTWKPNIMYDPAIQIKKEDIQEAFKKAEEAMNMRSGGGAPGLKHHIPCPEKKGQRGDEEVDRRERHRRELGISTSKLNDMVERIYELMCENEVTLVEGREILVEVGRIISEAERRSPNTRLSEIPRFSKTWN